MIVLLLTTKNEAEVLRLNLEHHLSWGVDHVVVCDNDSTDDTPDSSRSAVVRLSGFVRFQTCACS